MAKDHQLLNTARDYLQFVTNFFEVINVSATHIYHSALELSPLSSIIRKFYYHQRPCPSPRVVIGIPESWDPSIAVSTKDSYYLSSTWSPCGQLFAAVIKEAVEIRDGLTLKLLSTLQATQVPTRFRYGLAYSPDGRSLAGCSNTTIFIWDVQTGGVVREIVCGYPHRGLSLLWSLDGKTIGTLSRETLSLETYTVQIYDIASATTLSSSTFQSMSKPSLWVCGGTFQVMTKTEGEDHRHWVMNIFEVGHNLTKLESFPFNPDFHLGVFSPTTYWVSVSVKMDGVLQLFILDLHTTEIFLQEVGSYQYHTFSHDGELFAAFAGDCLRIWRYTSASRWYTLQKEFHQTQMPLQFSPTLSSILGLAHTLLYVLHLDGSPAAHTNGSVNVTHSQLLDAFPPDGTYIATAHHHQTTVTITNLHSQNPSPLQFIDTTLKQLSAVVLTGNVMLVKGLDMIKAWLLTEEGAVDGISGNTRASDENCLWSLQLKHDSNKHLEFSVGDSITIIRCKEEIVITYDTGTGEEVLTPTEGLDECTWYHFFNSDEDGQDLYHREFHNYNTPSEHNWPVSQTTLQEGWVKDPEGKHRLWLYARWRSATSDVDWFDEVTTLRLRNLSELVIIKF